MLINIDEKKNLTEPVTKKDSYNDDPTFPPFHSDGCT
jgi:hypothetical protein